MRVSRPLAVLPALLLASCLGDSDGGLLSPPSELALVLTYSGPQAVLADAFDQVDNLTVLVDVSGMDEIRVDRNGLSGASEIVVNVPVDLPAEVDQLSGTVNLQLRAGSSLLFEASQSVTIERGSSTDVVMELEPVAHQITVSPTSLDLDVGGHGQLTATVLFATGDEIPGAPVSWSTVPSSCAVTVDAAGRVSGVSVGTCAVEAQSGDAVAGVTVTVTAPSAVISGTVTAGGSGVSGVPVSLTGPVGRSSSTTSNGGFQFTGLPAGTYSVTITPSSGLDCPTTTIEATVARGGSANVSFSCSATGGSIAGTVTAESQPLSGITVSISGPTSGSTSTAGDGTYRFDGLQPGSYVVSLSGVPSDYDCPTTLGSQDVVAGQTTTVNFSCTVVRTASIGGQVTQGSTPLSGVSVSLSGPEGSASASTNGSGFYSFSGLRSGSYTVEITPPNGVTCPTTSTSVSLSTGQGATADFMCDPPASTERALVTNESSGTVSVVDVASNSVVQTLSVGSGPYDVDFTPDGSRAYVSNTSSGTVSVIDMTAPALAAGAGGGEMAQTVITNIAVGSGPRGVAMLPDGSRVYVPNSSSGTVSVINTSTNSVVSTISIGPYQPDAAVAYPGGGMVFVTLFSLGEVETIDTGSNSVVNSQATGAGPLAIAIKPDGTRLYTANFNANNVTVLDPGSLTVLATIPVGTNPAGLAVSPNGGVLYVTNYGSGFVSVIDTGSNSVIGSFSVPSGPHGVAFSADGSVAYVTSYGSNFVTVVDATTHTPMGTFPVGNSPARVAFPPMVP